METLKRGRGRPPKNPNAKKPIVISPGDIPIVDPTRDEKSGTVVYPRENILVDNPHVQAGDAAAPLNTVPAVLQPHIDYDKIQDLIGKHALEPLRGDTVQLREAMTQGTQSIESKLQEIYDNLHKVIKSHHEENSRKIGELISASINKGPKSWY